MNEPIVEHGVVVLTRDLPDEGLEAGDVGVVLLIHEGLDGAPQGFTIEVTTLLGETVAVVDVPADLVRPAASRDVRHARPTLMSA
jgi:hypothetical protein